jgi:hypothetical protein
MIRVGRIGTVVWICTALSVGLVGCTTQGETGDGKTQDKTKTTSLKVSGLPGTEFTVDYKAEGHSRSVTTRLTAKTPSATIVELAGDDLVCDVRKRNRSESVTVGIYREENGLFLTEVPVGTQGVRITRIWAGWKAEPY